MSKITIFMPQRHIDEGLCRLRKLGLVHIKPIMPVLGENISQLDRAIADSQTVLTILPQPKTETQFDKAIEPAAVIKEVISLDRRKQELVNKKIKLEQKIAWFKNWGKLSTASIQALKQAGINVQLYTITKKQLSDLDSELAVFIIHKTKKIAYIAVVCRNEDKAMPDNFSEVEFPDQDYSILCKELNSVQQHFSDINKRVNRLSIYHKSLEKYEALLAKKREFYQVRSGMAKEEGFWYLMGFIPKNNLAQLKKVSSCNGWAILSEVPGNPDEVPTILKNARWISFINPLLKMLGTIPGYAEYDVSLWFLLFLTLFFAILIGDAGYGILFLLGTFLLRRKFKQAPFAPFGLMYIFSGATVIWGMLSGTWFGYEKIAQLPFFHFFVIHRIDSFVNANQTFLMYLCFVIGAVHLTVAHSMILLRLRKSIAALGQIGWIMVLWGLFFVANTLVLAKSFPTIGGALLVVGVILIAGFSNPQKNFIKTIVVSLANLPLKLISSFADIVSYVRLFAVGYATVIVASTFNNMAVKMGFNSILSGFAAALILFMGHSLNILLGFMAIIVHGVRLNMLEFGGHLGLQWSGRAYTPFKE